MNIVFWFLVILALVFIWFCLAFAFRGFGRFLLRLFNDAMDEINETDEYEKNEGNTKEKEK